MIKFDYFTLIAMCGCINFIILLAGVIGGAATASAQGKLTTPAEATLFIGLIGLGLDLCAFAVYVLYNHYHSRHQIHTIEENEENPTASIPAPTAPPPPPVLSNDLECEHLIPVEPAEDSQEATIKPKAPGRYTLYPSNLCKV